MRTAKLLHDTAVADTRHYTLVHTHRIHDTDGDANADCGPRAVTTCRCRFISSSKRAARVVTLTVGWDAGRSGGGVHRKPASFLCSGAVSLKVTDTMKSMKKERRERNPQTFSSGSLLPSPCPFSLLSKCFLTSSQGDMFAGRICPPVLVFYGSAGSFDTDFPRQGPAWLGASSSPLFLCQTCRPPPQSPPSAQ